MKAAARIIVLMTIVALAGCGGGGGEAGTNGVAETVTGNSGTGTNQGNAAPVTAAPVTTAPVTTAPVTTAPVTTAPVTTAPVTTAPVTATPVTATPDATAGPEAGGTGGMEQEMVAAVNRARATGRNCGATYYTAAAPVAWNARITAAAVRHSNDMAANNFFSHTGSDGTTAGNRLTQAGYAWSAYGENLAVGYSTATAVVEAWIGSEGHCKNIMNPAYTEIGAGVVTGTYNGFSSMPYWTLDLARQR